MNTPAKSLLDIGVSLPVQVREMPHGLAGAERRLGEVGVLLVIECDFVPVYPLLSQEEAEGDQ